MTELKKLFEKKIDELVPLKEEREVLLQAISYEEKLGASKTVDLLDRYEKLIEGLLK